jgi:hypothetical protein
VARAACAATTTPALHAARAIPAPPRGVTRVVVSQGDDASACGVDEAGIVCWGEAYSPRGRPRVPVRVRVDHASDPEAPVVDSPGRWDAACDIKRPCTRDWAKPQRCEGPPGAVPWATLARHAGAQRGKVVSAMGNFVVGPGIETLMGCDRWGPGETGGEPPNAPRLCCNGSWAPLGLVSEGAALRLEDLAKKIEDEWTTNGTHRSTADKQSDLAIVHTDNSTPFSDVIAVIDATYTPKRDFAFAGKSEKVPSFNLAFAAN